MSIEEAKATVPQLCEMLRELGSWRNSLIRRQWLIKCPAVQSIRTDLRLSDEDHAKLPPKKSFARATELWKAMMGTLKGFEDHPMPESFRGRFEEETGDTFSDIEVAVAVKHCGIGFLDGRSLAYFGSERKIVEKEIERLALELPVSGWWCSLRGCGSGGLGKIIAETGDLSNYPNPDKVKKRLGLAPIRGLACSTWARKGGLSKEEWVEAGYNPRRRSTVFTIGDAIIKQKHPSNRFRAIYDVEKEKKTKEKEGQEDWTPMRLHRHAQRVMEQKLIIELWAEWNGVRR